MSQQERSELNILVGRCVAAWHEPGTERRRSSIARLWAEDGVQFTSSHEIREKVEGKP